MKNLVCAIYNHPEAYPPTLNAIEELSDSYDKIYLLYQHNLINEWQYPANVVLVPNGRSVISVSEQARLSTARKVWAFILFTCALLKLQVKYKPVVTLLYDAVPLFSYFLISKFRKKSGIVWYHNHDVIGYEHRKYSIAWFAAICEERMFEQLDVFSLPADERRKYFKMEKLKGAYFCVPNYPSTLFYSKFITGKTPAYVKRPRLIYQGSISDGHGLEEVISYIAKYNRNATLTIIGNANDAYKIRLMVLINELGVHQQVTILPPVNYAKLPAITVQHHIGLAINTPHNVIYATGATASNKMYEYAAVGLPILYFDNEHYNSILAKYRWAFATMLSPESIKEQIDQVLADHDQLSAIALSDFNNNLNFGNAFTAVKMHIKKLSGQYK